MGTAGLTLAGGFFGGASATALVLWFHERRTRRALEDVSGRLRRSEARTHTLRRDSYDVVAVVAGDGTIKYLSPAAEQIVGGTAAGFVGASFPSLVHPEDLEQVTAALAAPAAVDAGRSVEFRVRHARYGLEEERHESGSMSLGRADIGPFG